MTTFLVLMIDGVGYKAERIVPSPSMAHEAWRLVKADETQYTIAIEKPFGVTCTCPDWTYRRHAMPDRCCKHLKAGFMSGLLPPQFAPKKELPQLPPGS